MIFSGLLTILGLAAFEIISSIDNAVVNADVLNTMSPKGRRWFLIWGIIIAVFLVRGLLPWIIVWVSMPQLGFLGSFTACFSSDPAVLIAVAAATPALLMGGGMFLILLFLHWLFIEPKNFGLPGEAFISRQGGWFYFLSSLLVTTIVWIVSPPLGKAALVGSTAFFLTHGFKEHAEQAEAGLREGRSARSDLAKIMFLEVIDMCFSIDGVIGAFAFTVNVPLILLGNGLGAIVVRQLTVGNVDRIRKYLYLKNGAMYSIAALGLIMLYEAMGGHVAAWVSPITTFMLIGFFVWRSVQANRQPATGRGK